MAEIDDDKDGDEEGDNNNDDDSDAVVVVSVAVENVGDAYPAASASRKLDSAAAYSPRSNSAFPLARAACQLLSGAFFTAILVVINISQNRINLYSYTVV